MCLPETYSRVRGRKNLSDMFPIRNGLKLNGTHQFLTYDDDFNILGGKVQTVKENAQALVVATEEILK